MKKVSKRNRVWARIAVPAIFALMVFAIGCGKEENGVSFGTNPEEQLIAASASELDATVDNLPFELDCSISKMGTVVFGNDSKLTTYIAELSDHETFKLLPGASHKIALKEGTYKYMLCTANLGWVLQSGLLKMDACGRVVISDDREERAMRPRFPDRENEAAK